MKRNLLRLGVMLLCFTGLAGCNIYNDATNTVAVVGNIITIAQTDLPALQATGIFSATEGTNIANYLTAASTLNTQTGSCVQTAHAAGNKKSAFLACFNTFTQGLLAPQELALLRVINPKAQQTVQVWVTAVVLAVNTALQLSGGTPAAPPQVAALPASRPELLAFEKRLGLSYGF